jgi:RHH-type transcriptional regulator, proline utilization regulon repressor / proline dehydrogenase / delta 1-pyrroline-5-carboxylate dehydrogenase
LIAEHPGERSPVCVSIKLSALYSQCSCLNMDKSVAILSERLVTLLREAKKRNALVYLDAEDSATNQIIYKVFEDVFGSNEFRDFPYPGIVLQAYAKDAPDIAARLLTFADQRGAPIAIRLVKGAYWDHETVTASQNHWPSPLLTHKESSDAQYEKLSRLLLDNHTKVLPAFGSHNIRSLAHAVCYAEANHIPREAFELQMLYGMAEPIARAFSKQGYLVRLYVPLGDMIVGMGYLVRRLLENTSNESFLKHTFFDASELDELLREPQFKG